MEKSSDFDVLKSKDSETLRSTGKLGMTNSVEDSQESKFNKRIMLSDFRNDGKEEMDSNSPSPAFKTNSQQADLYKESESRPMTNFKTNQLEEDAQTLAQKT